MIGLTQTQMRRGGLNLDLTVVKNVTRAMIYHYIPRTTYTINECLLCARHYVWCKRTYTPAHTPRVHTHTHMHSVCLSVSLSVPMMILKGRHYYSQLIKERADVSGSLVMRCWSGSFSLDTKVICAGSKGVLRHPPCRWS